MKNEPGIAETEESMEKQQSSIKKEPSYGGARSLGKRKDKIIRMQTSGLFGIPSNFFQSRAEIRRWGVEKLVDPSKQPVNGEVPTPFHVPLPGYSKAQCSRALDTRVGPIKANRDPSLGPDLTYNHPPLFLPSFTPNPNFVPQKVGYDFGECDSYQMDSKPYVNAIFDPVDPSLFSIYDQNTPWTAYAYGVPRV